jgi:DNA invertase Pin-like site-specific DNA recombinase
VTIGLVRVTILGALGQMEVELLRERTKAGSQAARARGHRVGGRPKALYATKIAVIKALLAQGVLTVDEIAEQVGCATSTICRHLPGGRGSVAA